MQSMDKDGATVVDMVADWLEDNGYDGLTDGRLPHALRVGSQPQVLCGAPVPLHAMHPPDHL